MMDRVPEQIGTPIPSQDKKKLRHIHLMAFQIGEM